MNHQDAEISDVVIVLECSTNEQIDAVIENLKAQGLTIDEIDYDNSIVEGNIIAGDANKLQSVQYVRHVRSVFTYTADFPTGDPRDKDGAEDELDDNDE